MSEIYIREAQEEDIPQVRDIFYTAYGPNYPYQEFYDDQWLKKTVYNDNYLFLVAVEEERIVGTGSIYFEVGAYTDLIGEFGRLVVDPSVRGRGVGGRLMEARMRFANRRLHFGFVEARTYHPFAQRIAYKSGLRPLGFLPQKILFGSRESLATMGQIFRSASRLRRNNPRIIPEIFPIAAKALHNLQLTNDLIVVEEASSYPTVGPYAVEELTEEGIPDLLRIERGRLKRRQIFGDMMLSYGYFALQAKAAQYLVARQKGVIVGAIGFVYDSIGKTIKIFELIDLDDAVGGFLLRELDRRAREEMDVAYMEMAVSAYWPQMQRTLDQLGFCAVAYCPAYVFRGVERLDAIRMAKVFIPFDVGRVELIPPMEEMYELVVRGFMEKRVGIRIGKLARGVTIFKGLSDDQLHKITGICDIRRYDAGDVVFRQGEVDSNLYMVLSGEVDVVMGPDDVTVGKVLAGDVLGEIALVEGAPHSATAVIARQSQLIVLSHRDFAALIQRNPRIGMTVMRNIARSLGGKLKIADITVSQLYGARPYVGNHPTLIG